MNMNLNTAMPLTLPVTPDKEKERDKKKKKRERKHEDSEGEHPGETEEESLETIRYACSLPIDMAQFSVLVPYPGSPIFEQLRAEEAIDTGIRPDGSVDPKVWHRYSAYICFNDVQPIWTTPTQTPESLRRLQKTALRRFYLRPKQLLRQARRLRLHNVRKMADVAISGFF